MENIITHDEDSINVIAMNNVKELRIVRNGNGCGVVIFADDKVFSLETFIKYIGDEPVHNIRINEYNLFDILPNS